MLIPVVLATWLYAPALFCGKTQIHGDSITYSLSVIEFDRKMLHENISPLWTDLVYGGIHILLKVRRIESSQFGSCLILQPVVGQNIYHWLPLFSRQWGCIYYAGILYSIAMHPPSVH